MTAAIDEIDRIVDERIQPAIEQVRGLLQQGADRLEQGVSLHAALRDHVHQGIP